MSHKYFGSILAGKRALITGANRGLGLLMAHRFLECGAKVAIFCAPHEEIEPAVAELKALDPSFEVLGFKPNLTDEDALRKIMAEIEDKWGGLDILVNNAGNGGPSIPTVDMPQEIFDKVVNLDLCSLFRVMKAFGKVMVCHLENRCRIIKEKSRRRRYFKHQLHGRY